MLVAGIYIVSDEWVDLFAQVLFSLSSQLLLLKF